MKMTGEVLATYRYPDSAEGARRFVKDQSTFLKKDILEVIPDPGYGYAGVWKIRLRGGEAMIIYMAGYMDRRYNDFEVGDDGE